MFRLPLFLLKRTNQTFFIPLFMSLIFTAILTGCSDDEVPTTKKGVDSAPNVPMPLSIENPVSINRANSGSYQLGGKCNESADLVDVEVKVKVGVGETLEQATATADCQGTGMWSLEDFDVTAVDDSNNVIITVTHGTGTSVRATVAKDTVVPGAPTMTSHPDIDVGAADSYVVSGGCERGATVTVTVAGQTPTSDGGRNPTCSAEGEWTATFNIVSVTGAGATISATQTDGAGNPSTAAVTRDVRANHRLSFDPAPANIVVATLPSYNLRGGCTDEGANVVATVDGISPSDASVTCTSGTWIASFPVASMTTEGGGVAILVNHSTATPLSDTVQKDTVAPAQPVIVSLANIDRFNDHAYTVSGMCTAGAGEVITVAIGAVTTPSTSNGNNPTCDSDGEWSATFDVSSLDASASVAVTATQTDSIGNRSTEASATVTRNNDQVVSFEPNPTVITADNVGRYSLGGRCSEQGEGVTVNVGITGTPAQATTNVNCQSDQRWSVTGFDVSAVTNSPSAMISVSHGTATPPVSASTTVEKDSATPPAPTITTHPDINADNAASYTISGACESGATVTVTVAGQTPASDDGPHPTCLAAGTWTATFNLVSLTGGETVAIRATQTDGVGNTSPEAVQNVSVTSTHQLTFSSEPTDISVATGSTYTLSGTCNKEGAAITATVGGVSPTTSPVTCTSGAWTASFTVSSISAEGDTVISVSMTGAISLGETVAKDTEAPAQPVITAPGKIDRFNDHAYAVSGTCTAGAGEVISVAIGAVTTPTNGNNPTCDSDGEWSAMFDVTSLDADTTSVAITATQTDGVGNASTEASANVTRNNDKVITIDPAAVSITVANVDSYSLGGRCSEAGESVFVEMGVTDSPDKATISRTCGADQTWSVTEFDVSGVSDSTSLSISIGYGPDTSPLANTTVVKDVTAPTAPTIATSPNIDTSNDDEYTVGGTCSEHNREVAVTVGDLTPTSDSGSNPTCSDTGQWTATFNVTTLEAGQVDIRATQTDAVGNTSIVATRQVDRDTTHRVAFTSDPVDISIATGATYTLSGTCTHEGVAVTPTVAGDSPTSSPVLCSASEEWTANFDVSAISTEGNVSIIVGHSTATPVTATVVKDTADPALPTITTSPNIDLTNLASYTISGACESGATLTVTVGGISPTGAVTCSEEGSWTATFNILDVTVTSGTVTISATQTDGVGNTSEAATHDVSANIKHQLAFTANPTDINIATGATYTLSGTCTHEGSAVTAAVGGVSSTGDVTCTGGAWTASFTVSSISDGNAVSISVEYSNADALLATVVKDTTAPEEPVIVFSPGINRINDGAYKVSGSCTFGSEESEEKVIVKVGAITTPSSNSGVQPTCLKTFERVAEENNPFSNIRSHSNIQGIIFPEWVNLDGGDDFELVLGLHDGTLKYYKKNSEGKYEEQSGTNNPFNGIDVTLPGVPSWSNTEVVPTFADVDGNGTVDLLVGASNNSGINGKIHYFKNESDATSSNFTEQTGTDHPFSSVIIEKQYLFPKLVDVDGDNDFDLVVGNSNGDFHYYKNEGTTTTPNFTEQTGADNPFDGLNAGSPSRPTFADLDGDGDLDFMSSHQISYLYYENVSASYEKRTGKANPFKDESGTSSIGLLADVDGDGDFDFVKGEDICIDGTCRQGVLYSENKGDRLSHIEVAHAFWQTTFDVTSLSAGSVMITATQTDGVGNPSTQNTASVSRDDSTQLVNINLPAPNINIANQDDYPLGGQCSEVGPSSVTVNVGITETPNQATTTVNCESDNTWAVASFNLGGGVSESHDVQISVTHGTAASATATVAKDVTPPSQPLFNTPLPGITPFNHNAYTVSGTCTGTGEGIQVKLGSGTLPSHTTCRSDASWSAIFNASSLAAGTVTITVIQTDGVGNSSTASSVSVTRDNTPQSVTFSPAPGNINASNTESYPLGGTCSGEGELVAVTFGIEGDLDQVTVTSDCQSDDTWAIADNTSLVDVDESDSVKITAVHGSTASATATVVKDTVVPESPTISAPAISSGNSATYQPYTPSGTCESGATLTVTVAGVSPTGGAVTCSEAGTWTASFHLVTVLPFTILQIRATQRDGVGNTSPVRIVSLTAQF